MWAERMVRVVASCLALAVIANAGKARAATRHPNLVLNEGEIAEMKDKIAQYTWAGNLYNNVKAVADGALSASLYVSGGSHTELRKTGQKLRDLSLVYQISEETKYAAKVRGVLLELADNWFKGKMPYVWSCGFFCSQFLWAYDLTYDYGGWAPGDRNVMDRFFTETADACLALASGISNTQYWYHAYAGAVGYFYGNEQYIAFGIEDVGGFKDYVERWLKDGLFDNEATAYGPGYVLTCMTMLAEAALHYDGTDLYNWKSPSGNSLKGMFDGFIAIAFTTGRLGSFGDYGTTGSSGRYLYNPRYEFGYSRYLDPEYAWVLRRNSARSGSDWTFWGYPALTHGLPELSEAATPDARSGVYPGIGIAMLRAEEGWDYWGSQSLSVFVRFGGHISHAHRDQFGIVIHGYGKLLEPDIFMLWDYGTRGAGRNPTKWSPSTIAHNTVVVDKKDNENWRHGVLVPFQDLNEDIKVVVVASPATSTVAKTRILGLTREYLVDVFLLSDDSSHTYDWVVHGYGGLSVPDLGFADYDVGKDVGFEEIDTDRTSSENFWIINGKRGGTTVPWWAQFRQGGDVGVNLLFWEQDSTTVLVGDGPYSVSATGSVSSTRVPMVIVRKVGTSARFIVLHEPFNGEPEIASLELISQNGVKITSPSFLDYFFWSEQPSDKTVVDTGEIHIEFEGTYAYVRVEGGGITAQRGNVLSISFSGQDNDNVVSFTRPADGAVVSGQIDINAVAYDWDAGTTDGDGIDNVLFELLQGATVLDSHTEATATYDWGLDTTAYADGQYTLRATATSTGAAGGTSSSTEILIIVANTILPGLSWEAEDGIVISPFTVTDGYVSQSVQTRDDPSSGGRASYLFTITEPGEYVVRAVVDAPDEGSNSVYINIDGEPTSPAMIWDIVTTDSFEVRTASWRGSGTFDNSEFVPKVFTLSAGTHELIIRGRESDLRIDRISVERIGIDNDNVVSFTRPADWAVVSGQIALGDINTVAYDPDAGTADGDGIANVVFELLQGATVLDSHTDATATYDWGLDTTAYADGQYTLRATATSTGAAGGTSSSTEILIRIANTILAGLAWEAEDGIIVSPFAVTDGYVSQSVTTHDPSSGGRASYVFTITEPGEYVVKVLLDAPDPSSDSLHINIDGEPTSPAMIWDIDITAGFELRTASWRGSGTFDNNEFVPIVFTLSAGTHELIIRGRESDLRIDWVSVERLSVPEVAALHGEEGGCGSCVASGTVPVSSVLASVLMAIAGAAAMRRAKGES